MLTVDKQSYSEQYFLKKVLLLSFYFYLLFQSCVLNGKKVEPVQHHFVICTASYNNEKWALRYLNSIFSQDYKAFRVIYYDDGSTDKTLEVVTRFAEQKHLQNKITIFHNDKRIGPHENYYKMIHACKDLEIIVIVDGDDWLAHGHVLSHLAQTYATPNIWVTYGQFETYPTGNKGCSRKIPNEIIAANNIRSYKWVTSHLRTFYAWLYKLIKYEDFIFNGKFVKRAGDVATMFPLIEMAGFHSRFIPETLYIYNRANENNYGTPLGDAFASVEERRAVVDELRKKRPKYQPLNLDNNTVAKLCGFAK